ncbi:MAG: SH3 domain-containing protein [Devosia sp.]
MSRRTRFMMIAAGCTAVLGAMLLIPGGERLAIADAAAITDVTSQETIATIDAMLGAAQAEAAPQQVASLGSGFAAKPDASAKLDPNLQTAALTTPETDLEGAPLVDPDLRPDSIGPSAVNLRAGPSTATATVTVLQPGQPVQTGETDGGWVEITLADGTTGWVYSRYLSSVAATVPAQADEPAAKPEGETTKAVVKGKGSGDLEGRTARIEVSITARARPDSGARSVFRTEPGERVRILDVRGDWLHIRTADGSSGWIKAG